MDINKWKINNNNYNKILNIKSGLLYAINNDFTFCKSFIFSFILIIINITFSPNLLTKYISSSLSILILIFELLNTIIELIVDRIGLKYNILSKNIKDMSALFVFIYTVCYLCFSLFIIKYMYISYNKWKLQNKDKRIFDYIIYTFSI
jgi:diacylglycerol kinase